MFLSGVSFWPIGLGIGPESDYHFDFSPGSRLVSRASSALAKSGITDNYEDHSRLSWAEYDSKFLQYVLINHHALLKSQLKGRRPSKIARREIVRMFTKSAVAEKIIWHMLAALKKKESKNRLHIYIIYFLSEYLRGNKKSGFFAQKPKGSILEPARLFQQIKKTLYTTSDPFVFFNYSLILARLYYCYPRWTCNFRSETTKILQDLITGNKFFYWKRLVIDTLASQDPFPLLHEIAKKVKDLRTRNYIVSALIKSKEMTRQNFDVQMDMIKRAHAFLKIKNTVDPVIIDNAVEGLAKMFSESFDQRIIFMSRSLDRQLRDLIAEKLFDILENPKLFPLLKNKHKEALAYAMAKYYYPLKDKDKNRLIKLALRGGEFGKFLATLLFPHIKDIGIIAKLKKVLPTVKGKKFPPYETIFAKGKRELNFRLYFLGDVFYNKKWKKWFEKENFGKKVVNGGHLYSKMVGRRRVNLWVTMPAFRKGKLNIFERIEDRYQTDFIGYFGHAGGGAELSVSLREAQKREANKAVFFLSSCSSLSHYAPKVFALYPNSHFIGSIGMSTEPDNPRMFSRIYKGILARMSWKAIKAPLKHYGGWKDKYLFPNEQHQMAYFSDSDNDGIPDIEDPVYNLRRSEKPVVYNDFNYRASSVEPAQNLGELVFYLQARFHPNSFLKHFRDIRVPITSSDNFRNKGWFRHRRDRADFMKPPRLRQSQNGGTYFDIEINAGYQFSNMRALKMMAAYEIYQYFAKNFELKGKDKDNLKAVRITNPKNLSPQQKFWAYIKAVEVWALELHSSGGQAKRNELKQLHEKFLGKYKLPKTLTFDLSYNAYWAKEIAGTEVTAETDAALKSVKGIFGQ